jgi:hypothetical protein
LKTRITTLQSGGTGAGVTWVSEGGDSGSTTSREDLGEQTIEGVVAKGTRTTIVIPAGAIGNEQPLKEISEEWLAKDLKVLVLTIHADPRTGKTTYRLTNINRSEPNPSLFEVPAGYAVK